MSVAIRMPDMGTTVEECRVLSWRVQVGETVTRGTILAEIETDKAIAELESTANGVMLRRTVEAGQMARTGDILAYVGEPGETLSAEPEVALTPSESMGRLAANETVAQSRRESENVALVSPVVRNLAAKLHVDLAHVHGTGRNGMITREDVQKASQKIPIPSATTAHKEFPGAQAAVARAVQRSWQEIPHLYISAIIDMSVAERIRAEHKLKGSQITYDAIFLKALAMAVKAFPPVAAKLVGERVIRPEAIHIALAIGVESDLFLPVVKDVDKRALGAVQAEISDLVSRVRSGSLKSDQMTGAFTALSNLGMYPIEDFQAIIFPEHSSILAVGSVNKKPVVCKDRLEIRPLVNVKLAVDHRLINGRTAAMFMGKLKEVIEVGDIV